MQFENNVFSCSEVLGGFVFWLLFVHVVFSVVLFSVVWAFWFCGSMSITSFGNFSAIITSNILLILSLFSTLAFLTHFTLLKLSQSSWIFYSLSSFFVCVSLCCVIRCEESEHSLTFQLKSPYFLVACFSGVWPSHVFLQWYSFSSSAAYF